MARILVIGDVCKDVFIYGQCKRLSPEAPVPVFNPIEKTVNEGMAGNVVANLRAINPYLEVEFFRNLDEITKTRYVDKNTNHLFLRVDDEPRINRIWFTSEMMSLISDADAVVVSDYNKGFLTEEDIQFISTKARWCILDSKKQLTPSIISNYSFIKLNESEYKANKDALTYLNKKVIVTLGSRGAEYMNDIYPSPDPKETIDVSGAGDTFLAAFTIKYLETQDTSESIKYANTLSSIVVGKRGVVTP